MTCHLLLPAMPVPAAVRRHRYGSFIAEELLQVVMNVEHAVAILAAIGALGMAEHIDDMFYFGIMAEYPTWGNRLVIVCAYEAKAYAKPQGDCAARAGMSAWAQI